MTNLNARKLICNLQAMINQLAAIVGSGAVAAKRRRSAINLNK